MERPKKSAVAGLLDDHLVEVLSRLPIKDFHRSKCVSKGWLDLITDPFHRKKLPQTLQGFFASYPEEFFNESGGSFINMFGGYPPPIDPSLPFLKTLPGIRKIVLRVSCNGLLLFNFRTTLRDLGYIVFNPATEQWAAVPSEHPPLDGHPRFQYTFLVFNPAASSHFHLVILCEEGWHGCTVRSYSSKTGVWRHSQIDWVEEVKQRGRLKGTPQISGLDSHATVFNGMLYLILDDGQIAVVDVEGKTQRIILAPPSVGRRRALHHPFFWLKTDLPIFIGQSQGRLHCINKDQWADDIPPELSSRVYTRDFDDYSDLLSVWVLEDNDTQKWVHKHSVSFARLFGSRSRFNNYKVVAIHPDTNLVFIVLYWNWQLISYGLDSKEVRTIGTLKKYELLTPYVPCFLDFVSVAEHDEKLKGGRKKLKGSRKQARRMTVRAVAGDSSGRRAQRLAKQTCRRH